MPDLVVRASREVALTVSIVVHLLLGACLWAVAINALEIPVLPGANGGTVGWRQLQDHGTPSFGRNGLAEILYASDVVLVRLTSEKPAIMATGLVWWSPSRGLWFATDGFPKAASGEKYELWLLVSHQKPMSTGQIEIHSDGSARMLSVSDRAVDISEGTTVTIQLREMTGLLSLVRPSVVLQGHARVAK